MTSDHRLAGRGAPAPASEVSVDGASPSTLRGPLAASTAGKVAELVTLGLLVTIVPRALGPAAFGRLSVPLTAVTLGSLALTLGGPVVLGRFVPAAPPERRLALARAIGWRLARGRAAQVAALATTAAVAAVVAPDALDPTVTALAVAALALNVGTTLALQVVLGLGRAGPWAARWPLQNAVLITAVLVLHPVWGDVGGAVAILASALVGAVFAAVVVAPLVRADADPEPVPDGALRFGAHQALGAALTQTTHRGPVLAVAVLGGTAVQASDAALATGLALAATTSVVQTFTVSLPHVSGADRTADAEGALRRLATALTAALAVVAAGAALVSEPVIGAVLGTGFAGAADALVPALALVVLSPAAALAVQAAALRLRAPAATAAGVVAAATFVVVAVAAVPAAGTAGATGAALAGVAASLACSIRLLPGAIDARLGLLASVGVVAVLGTGAWT